jgi:hypothetical protein
MSSPRPSWRPLLAATGALFLIILAFLAGQVKAGGDPAIGHGTASTQQPQPPQQAAPPGFGDEGSSNDDDDDESDDDGFIPGGSQPAPPVTGSQSQGSSDAPTTHQS